MVSGCILTLYDNFSLVAISQLTTTSELCTITSTVIQPTTAVCATQTFTDIRTIVSTTTVTVSVQSTNIATTDHTETIIGGLLAFIIVLITIASIIAVCISFHYGKSLGRKLSYNTSPNVPTTTGTVNLVAMREEIPPSYADTTRSPNYEEQPTEPEYAEMAPAPIRHPTDTHTDKEYANFQHNNTPPELPSRSNTVSYSHLTHPTPVAPSSDHNSAHDDPSYDLATAPSLPLPDIPIPDIPIPAADTATDISLEEQGLYEELNPPTSI